MAFNMNVDTLDKEKVTEVLNPTDQQKGQLAQMASENTKEIVGVDLNSLEQRRMISKTIDEFGKDVVEKSSQKNKLLDKTLADLAKSGSEGSVVVDSLGKLEREMKELDPGAINFNNNSFFGKIFNPVKGYFQKYEKADTQIQNILESLEAGKRTLVNDNTTLEIEQASLRDLTQKLSKQVEIALDMDRELEVALEQAKVNNEDPEKIKYIEEEVLFPLRQKVMDLQQMQAVNQQGYFAMEIVRRNNKELIRAVERAQHVTVSALRTAVTVASALYNQKIVLDKVKILNESTNNLIRSTSSMLKNQGAQIQEQAMSTNITVDTLKEAFQDTFEALDQLDTYKQKALPQMRENIQAFREMAEEGDRRLARIDSQKQSLEEYKNTVDMPKIPQ